MKQHEIHVNGSRMVVIIEDSATTPRFHARLYLNDGETASTQCWKGKTWKAAQAWAQRMVRR